MARAKVWFGGPQLKLHISYFIIALNRQTNVVYCNGKYFSGTRSFTCVGNILLSFLVSADSINNFNKINTLFQGKTPM